MKKQGNQIKWLTLAPRGGKRDGAGRKKRAPDAPSDFTEEERAWITAISAQSPLPSSEAKTAIAEMLMTARIAAVGVRALARSNILSQDDGKAFGTQMRNFLKGMEIMGLTKPTEEDPFAALHQQPVDTDDGRALNTEDLLR